MSDALRHVYPEMNAGGFTRRDGTVEFYTRLAALLSEDMTVLDLGAGRGAFTDDPLAFRRQLCSLQGRVRHLVGADVDPAVKENSSLDDAVVLTVGAPLPFDAETFDMVVSDHTMEHVNDPVAFTQGIDHVLRPGGWFCARTPHRFGTTGLAANLLPNSAHAAVLRRLQPTRKAHDVFPTRYRLNTLTALRRAFPEWAHHSYLYRPKPGYLAQTRLRIRLGQAADAILPGPVLMIFIRKPGPA